MKQIIEMVDQFLEQAGPKNLPVAKSPWMPGPDKQQLVIKLLREEVRETAEATLFRDYLDGLGDVLFVALAAVRNAGVNPLYLLQEICRSNLTKFREGWKLREDGKVIKSPDYEPPDLYKVINETIVFNLNQQQDPQEKTCGLADAEVEMHFLQHCSGDDDIPPQQRATAWEPDSGRCDDCGHYVAGKRTCPNCSAREAEA